ncbi:MAG: hypothetical protein KJN66_04600 [Bacteroidia bacterium]|nr:hypothetical protein [Bacteroidia bacterium]
MQQIKNHIISKAIVLLLSVILLAPVFVKLNHLFEDHRHEVCITPFTNHFHEYEIDCVFYDFTLNTNFLQPLASINIPEVDEFHKPIRSQYHFISDYQQLQFSLRGPPLSV